MEEIQDNCYLPRSGRPTKITSRATHIIFSEDTKDPRVTSKRLKVFLTLANINVHESTIKGTLNNNVMHGKVAKRKPLLSKKNITPHLQFSKDHVDRPEGHWKNVLWTDETKIEGRITHGLKQVKCFFQDVAKSYPKFAICETCYRAPYLKRAKKIRFTASPHTMFLMQTTSLNI